jgi:rare lipoprotein A
MWCPKYGCAVVLAACLADPAAAQVLGEGPPGRFEALFESSREPIFARSEVSSLFPAAELMVRDETGPEEAPAIAEAAPVPDVPAPLAAGARTVTKLIEELVISPAESAPAPAQPAQDVAAGAAVGAPGAPLAATPSAEEPTQAQATGTVATGPMPPSRTGRRLGVMRAAWYQHSGRTASGEKYNPDGLTAAHRTLPLGTRVRVVNQRNGRSVVVRINDRVPKTAKLPVDLSRASARAIGMTGIAPVALYEMH